MVFPTSLRDIQPGSSSSVSMTPKRITCRGRKPKSNIILKPDAQEIAGAPKPN
jgi:hypothetical protein